MLDVFILHALGASQTELRQFVFNNCNKDFVPKLFERLHAPTQIERFLAIRSCSADMMSELVTLLDPISEFESNWIIICLCAKIFFSNE